MKILVYKKIETKNTIIKRAWQTQPIGQMD